MCCFFRTTVTSFCVKSHSRNSHVCVGEPVRSGAALLYLTRNQINSRRIGQRAGQVLGMFTLLLLAVTASVAAVMFVDVRPVLCRAVCCLLSCYKVGCAARGAVMSCYFSPSLHINSLDACCLWPFSGVCLALAVISFGVVFCRKV